MTTARQVLDAAMTEADWQAQVVEFAELMGWFVFHDPDPGRCRNCGTMVLDNRKRGFPDLELIRGREMKRRELKTMKGRASTEQEDYIERINEVEVVSAGIWRPSDWPLISVELR